MAGRRVAERGTAELAHRLDALRAEIARFPPRVAQRGRRYAVEGHVVDLSLTATGFWAAVEGTNVYDCGWEWVENGGGWHPDCTCPVSPECKHTYALAYCVLEEIPVAEAVDDAYDEAYDDALDSRRDRAIAPPAAVDRRRPTPARRGAGARSALALLRAAPDLWTRRHALEMLLSFAPIQGLAHAPAVFAALEEPDADLACWRATRAIANAADGWLPRELEDYRRRDDLAARYEAREQQRLTDELAVWARTRRNAAERSLRLVFGLARHGDGSARITLEVRLTSARLRDEPRTITQIQQLRTEIRRDPSILPAEQAALLDWLPDYNTSLPHGGWMPGRPVAVDGARLSLSPGQLLALLARLTDPADAIASWSDADGGLDPELAARGGARAGAPVRLRPEATRLLPTLVERDDTVRVEMAVFWPDRTERPLDEVVAIRGADPWSAASRSLVLAEGAFSVVSEEPPAGLLARFAAARGLPLPPARRAEVIGMLGARFPHLEATIAKHRVLHAVTPAVALDLRDDDWLQVRLFAHGGIEGWRPGGVPEDGPVFEYAPGSGWTRLGGGAEGGGGGRSSTVDDAYDVIASLDDPRLPVNGDPVALPAGATEPEPGAQDRTSPGRSTSTAVSAPHPPAAAAPEVRAADAWIEAPDPDAVTPAIGWLEGMGARSGAARGPGGHQPPWPDHGTGWWMQARRQRMDAFAVAWETRPPGVAYFGTERVRRLLAGGRVTARVRVAPSGIDWFTVSAEWEAEGRTLSDADLAKLRAATTCFVRLESGWVRREIVAEHDEATALLADLGVEPGAGEQRVGMWQLAGARPETLAALARLGADAEAVRAIEDLRARIADFAGLPEVALPAGLVADLRPYQRRGLDFLAYTSSLGLGAVLADDMGLGKTVQALAWLAHLRAAAPDGGPALVVCPASVVHNWVAEAARFTPALRVLVLTRGRERHALREAARDHDLVVTNYALLRRDHDEWAKLDFRAVILDEAQNVKNPDAAVTRTALALRARHRLALTGTPLENRALDLWSIVSFLNPGYLGTRSGFVARFDQADAPPHARMLLAAKLRPILLRRLKREVAAELPPRIEELRHCVLTRGQRQLYLAELARSRRLVDRAGATPERLARNKITILAALTRLRQICCHPALAGGTLGLGSGKFDALMELLEPLRAEGHKVLVFSQFVRCLRLLRAELERRDVACHVLTGQTVKREQVVRAFGEDTRPCVFLISLRAGGTGLNLTSASYVVLFDPWWNPAVEAQAIDRTHRIGQDRTVIAYRMLTEGTIEEKIWALQQRKAALARDVLGEDGFARTLTRDDLEYLLAEG